MKNFFNKYFEYILIALTTFFLFAKQSMPQYGERISMLFFGSLSFYYLSSGVLVFLDKKRVSRMMRLVYLFGLWSVSITVLAVMARTLLLNMDKELLIVSFSSGIGLMLYLFLFYKRIEIKDRADFQYQIQPLFYRSLLSLFFALGFLLASNYAVYQLFGTYKNDKTYVYKIVNAYEHPKDSVIVNDFNAYDAQVRGLNLTSE